MARNYRDSSKEEKPNPLRPLIGFIILVVLGGTSYLVSEPAVQFITSTPLSLPMLGAILPLEFPANWSAIARQGAVGGFVFALLFILFMIVALALSPPSTQKDETYVDLADLRNERERKAKEREKAAKRARRRR